jgi:hypothetical protein
VELGPRDDHPTVVLGEDWDDDIPF